MISQSKSFELFGKSCKVTLAKLVAMNVGIKIGTVIILDNTVSLCSLLVARKIHFELLGVGEGMTIKEINAFQLGLNL